MKILFKTLFLFLFLTKLVFSSEIGVIGFVIGDAFNQDGKKLKVGDPIFFGDTITTEGGGKSQLLFIDQTVMTVGSNTELTIDEFVYDAENQDGKLLSTIKSGSVKILTGKISEKKPENLVVETPAGTIGTRGTEFKAAVDPETQKSKILLIGPGPKNSLGLRPGAVEVSNAAGTVLLDKPYLFTEVNQNTAPKQPTIIPQTELKKFQELEIEPDAPVTENNQQEEEIQLAGNEDEIKELIKSEIFSEDQDVGDLVLDTLVTALAKDDGGITAQLLGKSFLNSGAAIPRALIPDDVKEQLPEGVDINSPEADAFFANELQNELEKVMLVSARIEDVEFVPTEFNQFNAGFSDIKVPIFNDETGDVVFLEMGDIDFKPQFAGLNENDLNLDGPSLNEQIFLKGQDSVAIDLEKGRFFEQEVDPQIEALNQRFESLLASGASPQELDQVALQIDQVIFEVNEAAQAFEIASFQNQFGNDFKLDVFSNDEFQRTKESFIFDTNQYSNEWQEANQVGLVPIFELDGSVSRFQKEEADTQWQIRDEQYEQQFSEQFPDIFAAEKKAEELGEVAELERKTFSRQIDEAKQAGASDEELAQIASKASEQFEKINAEVIEAKEEIKIAQFKTEVIEIGADEILQNEKPQEEIKVEDSKLETPEINFDQALRKFIALKISPDQLRVPVTRDEINSFTVGTTSYADLNTRSTGTDVYTGTRQNLYVDQVASGSASVGDVAGYFTPKHEIDYSNRTIRQIISDANVSIGTISNKTFAIDKTHTYTSSTTGNVKPSFVVRKGGKSTGAYSTNSNRIEESLTGDVTRTVPNTGYTDATEAVYITLDSTFNNQNGRSFADTVDTTIVIQTRDEANGSINKVSGTSSDGRD